MFDGFVRGKQRRWHAEDEVEGWRPRLLVVLLVLPDLCLRRCLVAVAGDDIVPEMHEELLFVLRAYVHRLESHTYGG